MLPRLVAVAAALAIPAATRAARADIPSSNLTLALANDDAVAVDHDPARGPLELAMLDGGLRWTPRHNDYVGDPIVAIDGGVGVANAGGVPYAASARIGSEMEWYPGQLFAGCADGCQAHRTGALIGVRLDAVGDRVPSAWTVPIDAYWSFPGRRVRLGLDAGVRWRFAGADRALGWSAGGDLVAPGLFGGTSPIAPRDLRVGLRVEQLADSVMIGVSIGISSSDRYDPARHPGV